MSKISPKDQKDQQSLLTVYHPPKGGIFAFIPTLLVPYAELMRLDRPDGFWAFYWHYAIGLGFAASVAPAQLDSASSATTAAYLAVWVTVLRGAVCTINDNLDQEFDRKVARTRFRPIARGAVSSTSANVFLLILVLVGMAITAPLPSRSWPHAASIYIVLSIYPLGKRITDFPQVVLGFGFALPVFFCCEVLDVPISISGASLAKGSDILVGATCTFIASALWTIIFDTVYAHQDIEYDVGAGVKSLAVRLGDNTRTVLSAVAVVQLALQTYAGYLCSFGVLFYVFNVCGAGIVLSIMLATVDLTNPADCAWWFGPGSKMVGASLVTGFICQYALHS